MLSCRVFVLSAKAKPVSSGGAPAGGEKKQFSWEKKKAINKKDYMIMDKKNETIVRQGIELNQFVIDGCEGCDIFVLDPTATASVDYCKDCRIFMAPIESSIFVRNCERCTFVFVCQQFRSRECTDCKFGLFSQTEPIIEMSSGMEFSCFPINYFSLKSHLDICKINAYSNKWAKIFDFNKKDDGTLNYSLAAAYTSKEKLKTLCDFEKAEDFGKEVLQFQEDGSGSFPAVPNTLASLDSKSEKTPENRSFLLFLEVAQVELFMQKLFDSGIAYEVLDTRILGVDEKRAKQLGCLDMGKLNFSRGDVPCIGIELVGEGLNEKISLEKFPDELKEAAIVAKNKVADLSELFFVAMKDDEGMAHSLK